MLPRPLKRNNTAFVSQLGCMQVDVGIATSVVAAIEERLTLLIKSHPSEYLKDTLDVKIVAFAPEGLKVKLLVMWRYTFPREFVNGVPRNPLQSVSTPVAPSSPVAPVPYLLRSFAIALICSSERSSDAWVPHCSFSHSFLLQ